MGKDIFTRSLYTSARAASGVTMDSGVTAKAEQKAKATGKLETLVDPSSFGVIRLSLPRVEKLEDGRYQMSVGTPMPVETRIDTTGSMGGNVDIAMKVMPDAFECLSEVLGGYDIHIATGIFGDVSDDFPLCRPQFEMDAAKIVEQLSMMVPERAGGDAPEDPDLGIFGAAYLCRHYINRIGLKGYDFTVTDAPGRGKVSSDQLKRVFGPEVFNKVTDNGHELKERSQYELRDIWDHLLERAHAFILLVRSNDNTYKFWEHHCGSNRVVILPGVRNLPQVQAAIVGLTEGTLKLSDVSEFLTRNNMDKKSANEVAKSLANIPIGAQAQLPNFAKKPMKGDIFADKPDVWEDKNIFPITSDETTATKPMDGEEDDWV